MCKQSNIISHQQVKSKNTDTVGLGPSPCFHGESPWAPPLAHRCQ